MSSVPVAQMIGQELVDASEQLGDPKVHGHRLWLVFEHDCRALDAGPVAEVTIGAEVLDLEPVFGPGGDRLDASGVAGVDCVGADDHRLWAGRWWPGRCRRRSQAAGLRLLRRKRSRRAPAR